MCMSTNKWIRAAWRRETLKEENNIVMEAITTMEGAGVRIQFEGNIIQSQGERIEAGWKPTWKKVKDALMRGVKCNRIEAYKTKEQQSKLFVEQGQEYHLWLFQNLHPRKTA